ncbi:DUF6890 family protein [Type-E symbiont of Plautia stali]|uniref:DUF6890 family protein n=1 Tax=Type-E symbiont of Plautia stali TaxID=1560357 RepID=UPI0035B669B0
MDSNGLEQYSILRRHWLPNEDDSLDSLSAALWLDNKYWENQRIAVANGIALAFKGKE